MNPDAAGFIGVFEGPTIVPLENMVDEKDTVPITADLMLHFIVEIFNVNLITAFAFQRLLVCHVYDSIKPRLRVKDLNSLKRDGDDIWLWDRKLSVSIATTVEGYHHALIHLGLNVNSYGAPTGVPIIGLSDMGIESKWLGMTASRDFANEFAHITHAMQHVRPAHKLLQTTAPKEAVLAWRENNDPLS